MADAKKKKTTTVRTRVVGASEEASSPRKQKVKQKSTKEAADKSKKTVTKKVSLKSSKKSTKPKKVGYFKGAWLELKQVRWPDRKSTWSLTFAVIVFTAFFVTLILLMDAGFKYLFDFIIK